MALTEIAVRNAKPSDKPRKLTDGQGLFLLIQPNGGKYWRGAYRFDGKQKTLALGVYPAVSVAQARIKWAEAKQLVQEGVDPGQARKQAKAGEHLKTSRTFEVVAREWHKAKRATWEDRTAQDNIHRLETDIFPEIGAMPIHEISAPTLLKALRKIEDRGALEMTSRVRGICSRVFKYAIACGDTTNNPADPVREALTVPEEGHFASIEVDDLPQFVRTLRQNHARMLPATRIAMNIMMLTFTRTKELVEAPWSEIDLENALWIVPKERMKKKRDHMVPLSRQVVALFKEIYALTGRNHYVFPNQRRPKEPMSNGAILGALKRMGYKGEMTGHGFRSLAMSAIKQELRYPHEVVDLQLAHAKKNKVDAAYDRAKFLKERTKMMQDWSDYIDRLASAVSLAA